MFCPQCGIESVEKHRFCKTCGANLGAVSDAMSGSEDPIERLKADAGRLKDTLVESGVTFGYALKNEASKIKREARRAKWQAKRSGRGQRARSYWPHSTSDTDPIVPDNADRSDRADWEDWADKSTSHGPLVKAREWLRLSWQYNLRGGLISLFSGLAQGAVLYYLFHVAISAGTIEDLEARANIHGFRAIAEIIWLIAAIPVMKGLGQIIYAAFFAESIKTLSERFAPQARYVLQPTPSSVPWAEASSSRQKETVGETGDERGYEPVRAGGLDTAPTVPPASVTEQTTNILERSRSAEPKLAGKA